MHFEGFVRFKSFVIKKKSYQNKELENQIAYEVNLRNWDTYNTIIFLGFY